MCFKASIKGVYLSGTTRVKGFRPCNKEHFNQCWTKLQCLTGTPKDRDTRTTIYNLGTKSKTQAASKIFDYIVLWIPTRYIEHICRRLTCEIIFCISQYILFWKILKIRQTNNLESTDWWVDQFQSQLNARILFL